jgi:hypothetical protein
VLLVVTGLEEASRAVVASHQIALLTDAEGAIGELIDYDLQRTK